MLVALALAVLITSAVGVKLFNRACDGSLEGLRSLSNVRERIAAATALPPTPPPATSTPVPAPAPVPAQASAPTPTPVPTPPPPPTPPGPTVAQRALALLGLAGDKAIAAVLLVKQSDLVAYPAHVAAAYLLDAAGCGKDAVRLQWLKAGLHTSDDDRLAWIAARLRESATDPDDLADLRRVVRTWSERAGQSVALRRVLAALEAQSS